MARPSICPTPSASSTSITNGWSTSDDGEQTRIWKEMLRINAKNVFSIGTVTRELQPVVVSNRLHNVPEKAIFAFEPTSYFGVYRMEEFFFSE